MEVIGIICEYNPFHNGHIYHIQEIKKRYPESILILVLNGYFLERGEISFLTKEDKTKIALDNNIDLVVELPVFYGTQSADFFADAALKILNELKVSKIVFGSESNNMEDLLDIAKKQIDSTYIPKVKQYLKQGLNYPTALAKSLNIQFDFNNPNDLLAISYLKAILKNNYKITPLSIKRTSSYHDKTSSNSIISASNIRNKLVNCENIDKFVPNAVIANIKIPNYELFFKILKVKILTTPNLEQFLSVDEGIENRLKKMVKISTNLEELIKNIKTKRYTYNKINRMFIHILLGITKESKDFISLDYLHILGFNNKGQKYLNSLKKELTVPLTINKKSLLYQYEINAAIIFDLIQNTNTFKFEVTNKPIKKNL